ncbi:MAG TPA: hypothetical protein VFQ36_21120 [Ktedonobacteraceae bacterium]|nr:hypothetical protein [Ktedonobacteraceae bacterium]
MRTFSKEARERPYRTIEATKVLREKAEIIERATNDARADEIIVAVVRPDLSFGGVWTLARADLSRQIFIVEDEGGWSLLFSPRTSLTQIEGRCDELARIAQKKGEVMQRWANRHPDEIQE